MLVGRRESGKPTGSGINRRSLKRRADRRYLLLSTTRPFEAEEGERRLATGADSFDALRFRVDPFGFHDLGMS